MTNKEFLIIENLEMVCEAKEADDKHMYIEGIVAQSEVINGNRRRYPKSVLEAAVKDYNEQYVLKNKALGELNHPPRPYVDPQLATHRIVEMKMVGNDVWAKAIVLEDATKLKALIKSGWLVQASTRGLGNVKAMKGSMNESAYNEVTSYKLTVGFDIVQDQSAPGATMNQVYESGLYEAQANGEFILMKEEEKTKPEQWDKVFSRLSESLK